MININISKLLPYDEIWITQKIIQKTAAIMENGNTSFSRRVFITFKLISLLFISKPIAVPVQIDRVAGKETIHPNRAISGI